MKNTGLSLIFLVILGACKAEPEPINYGSDGCHYCSMTIVDKQHAAEYVTDTGKAFKFDAIECMINSLMDTDTTKVALFLVIDFQTPGHLIDGREATYLISETIPSPMGEYLSAFESEEVARMMQSEQDGALFTWQELNERYTIR